MRRSLTFALFCAALGMAAVAPPALAHPGQMTIVQDDALVYRGSAEVRERALDEFKALGADAVKLQVYWNEVAPPGSDKPAGFDATDPNAYAWGAYDDAVRGILARGMRPYLALGGRGPDWATVKRSRYRGTYRPDPEEFGLFARAAGARFPEVDIWSVWNEPNLFSWLAPQYRKGVAISPAIYRRLYLAGHSGLSASGQSGDRILLGELMPNGRRSRSKVAPLEFLREMVCLNRRYRPYRGLAARRRSCPRAVGRIPTSGLAYHPYTTPGGDERDEASIFKLRRVRATLDALARRGKLPHRTPVWITEFGWQTDPPDTVFGVSLRRAPGLMDQSEWIAFRDPRVASYAQYTLRDDPPRRGSGFTRWAGWQAGLRFWNGGPKRGVYEAFRMPAFVRLLGRNRVEVFGGLRTAGGERATIDVRVPRGRYRSLGSAQLNAAGYFRKVFRIGRAADARYRITIGGRAREKSPVSR